MLASYRLLLLVWLILGFIVGAEKRPNDPSDPRHRRAIVRAARDCRRALRILGVKLRLRGRPVERGLYVSNHLSYVDAVVLMATRPTLFITSREVRSDPLLGRIAYAGGCDFVERRHVGNLREECRRIADHLRHVPVLVFPEGTSSNGSAVLPFRPAFFTSAVEAGGAIQPLCIRYPSIDGRPFGPTNHARVCWYGDMAFLPHLLQLLSVRRLEAEVHYLPPIAVANSDRKTLASESHQAIAAAFAAA